MPSSLRGREKELDATARLAIGLQDGPAALVFEGEAGIGKTTLWQHAIRHAQDEALVVVLSAAPAQSEAHMAFAALADMLEPVVDGLLHALPEPQRRALAVAMLREAPAGHSQDQRAVAAAVLSVLRALTQTSPVLIAIDDIQWLDRPTAHVLAFAARRAIGLPVGVLACDRIGELATLPLELEKVFPAERVSRVRLGPLSLAVLHDLVAARLGRSLPRRTLLRIEAAAGGNPFYALEIARSLPDDAQSGGPILTLPRNVRELAAQRLDTLPHSVRLVLLAGASLSSPTWELVRRATVSSPAAVRRARERATASGVLEPSDTHLRFSHPLYAAAVYATASLGERRLVHRRLALISDGIEERARHTALGADAPDERCARLLDSAAEHARARGAPETAAELAEYARHLTPPDVRVAIHRRSIRLAEYRLHTAEFSQARQLLDDVLVAVSGGQLRADALRLLAEISYHENSFPEATRLLEEALEHVSDDPQTSASIELHLTYVTVSAADFVGIESHAREALALAERAGEPDLLAEALAVSAIAEYLRGRGLDRPKIDRALRLENVNRQVAAEMRPTVIAGYLAMYEGELDRALNLFSRMRERFVNSGEEIDLVFVSSQMMYAECLRGDLAAAGVHAREAIETAERIDSPASRCIAFAFAALVAALAGDTNSAVARAEQVRALAAETGFMVGTLWAQWALAVMELSQGNPGGVDLAVGPFAAMVEQQGLVEPVLAPYLADEIEALIGLGQLERAERLTAMLEAAAERLQRKWVLVAAARCRALLSAACGDLDRAAQSAAQAVAACAGLEMQLEVARTLMAAGEIERRRRRKLAAIDLLRRSVDIFDRCGAQLWAERARQTLRTIGTQRAPADRLSAAERRVAELAASGATNRAVAAALFMSPKTVESHLARVYRKLDIRSRAELGASIRADVDRSAEI